MAIFAETEKELNHSLDIVSIEKWKTLIISTSRSYEKDIFAIIVKEGVVVSKFPSNFDHLVELERLELDIDDLRNIPLQVLNLKGLKSLVIQGNIDTLPEEIKQNTNLKELDLRRAKLPIPQEVLERTQNPKVIISYFFSLVKKPLGESKVLVVGQGSVGKTSLVNRILSKSFNRREVKTEGIAIKRWIINKSKFSKKDDDLNDKSRTQLNLWDFGGQEIMHATHQFFLTKRSLYLLVLDSRLTQEENRVEYWLKIIQSFGGESPVIIVGNKIDQHPLDIDKTGLQKKYKNVVSILETSAANGSGIKELKKEIANQIINLPHVHDLMPVTWFEVKTKLEKLRRGTNFITKEDYYHLCENNLILDEDSQKTLIGFLHDLGIVLHFQDDPRLEALGILNPEWVTNGVYKILNSHDLFQSQGKLTIPALNHILNEPNYPTEKRFFIVDMMKKFELCYDIEPDKVFLIPDLLPKDEPYTGEWNDALAFQFHYNVLPSSIITRFIVRMNPYIHKTVWRSGVVLNSSGNTALIKSDSEEKKIYIFVNGNLNTRRDFLSAIRLVFDAIHKTIAKIVVVEKVPIPGTPYAQPVDYEFLLKLEIANRSTFPIPIENKIIDINVKSLLDGITTTDFRQKEIENKPLRDIAMQEEKISAVEKTTKDVNPWRSGAFYLISFFLGFGSYLFARTLGLSGYEIIMAFGVGVFSMVFIGIMQLRNDEKLEDASLVALIKELFARFPLFSKTEK